MSQLSRYILSRITLPFLIALFVILLTLVLERLMRLIQLVTDEGTPAVKAFELLWHLIPHYLATALPAALFVALILSLRKMQEQSELTAMFATGISLESIIRPVLGLSLGVMLLMAALVSYVQPLSRYAYQLAVWDLTKAQILTNLRPGVFENLGADITLRADTISKKGKIFTGFFSSVNENGNRTIITAQEAIRVSESTDPNSDLTLLLKNGKMVRERSSNGTAATISFTQFYWNPPLDNIEPYGPRGQTRREMTLPELFEQKVDTFISKVPFFQMQAEKHARIVFILSVPILALLAIPLAMLGGGRTGRAYGIVVGVIVLILYEKILGFGEAFAALGNLSTWVGLWTPLSILAIITATLIAAWMDAPGYRAIKLLFKKPNRKPNRQKAL